MAKVFPIKLVIMLGIFLIPGISFACGKEHKNNAPSHSVAKYPPNTRYASSKVNNCCKTAQPQEKDCCHQENSQNGKPDDGCNGKCGHSSCHCTTVNFRFTLPFIPESVQSFMLAFKKQFFPDTNCYISSGFYSIWQPPKIS